MRMTSDQFTYSDKEAWARQIQLTTRRTDGGFGYCAGTVGGRAEWVQVVEQDLRAAAVAEVLDFAEQLSCVGAALVPSLVQVGLELLEHAATSPGAGVDQ